MYLLSCIQNDTIAGVSGRDILYEYVNKNEMGNIWDNCDAYL